jgi:1,2-phenylacetyl-CoA epoxidase catalytic subunit
MRINCLPYRVYSELANGFKAKGRPRKRWRDDIKDTLQQYGLTVNDATRQTRARIP